MIRQTVVFFGTGPVAAQSLEFISTICTVEMVITKPRPQHHHGPVPVLDTAKHLGLPVQTVTGRADLDVLMDTHTIASPLGILVDFGIIVSQKVIDTFPIGIINSHFSILPELRGADPITFAILSGQPTTGVSLMRIVEAMDEGPLLSFSEVPIDPDMTTPELTTLLIGTSNHLLEQELPKYIATQKVLPQSVTKRGVSYSRKLTKDDALLDWQKPADQLEREIRAFITWPGSKATIGNHIVAITKAHVEASPDQRPIGTIITSKHHLAIQTSKDLLVVDQLKPAGKNEMSSKAYLAGYGKYL